MKSRFKLFGSAKVLKNLYRKHRLEIGTCSDILGIEKLFNLVLLWPIKILTSDFFLKKSQIIVCKGSSIFLLSTLKHLVVVVNLVFLPLKLFYIISLRDNSTGIGNSHFFKKKFNPKKKKK